MMLETIPVERIDLSQFNARKDLQDGQQDSRIEDLARSIERRGLLNPITVFRKPDERYELVAGQRRLLACQHLGWSAIPAVLQEYMEGTDAIATSLVENFHRADMNPNDKIAALTTLLARLGDVHAVSKETALSVPTVRKYVSMQALAPQLRGQLAAGETRSTEALSRLARTFQEPDKQVHIWDRIGGFTQEAQEAVIKELDPDLETLDELVNQVLEGRLGYRVMRNCPADCPTIPGPLKRSVAQMLEEHYAAGEERAEGSSD